MRNKITQQAIDASGGYTALARLLKVSVPTVHKWKQIPPERCLAVEKISGINRHKLRPDVYDRKCPVCS